ncbi:MAG: SIS domain-containing protein [Rhodobacteraceae bacterium]|jgi:glucosamine--fructose-6-phosphate aminotransferase (isomerizing)|nr:SIS domain-containing protein [Paracoccaceae bacterium]
MAAEIAEIPAAAARLAEPAAQAALDAAAAALRGLAPPAVLTLARGSSEHAATVIGYAAMLRLGLPVASVPPSLASVHGRGLAVRGMAAVALSQSGASPDLLAAARSLVAGGARLTVLTNRADSPLAALGGAIDVRAGPERAVAATKSFTGTVATGLWLIAGWARDEVLAAALRALPEAFAAALAAPADGLQALFAAGRPVTFIGRGPGLGLAQEAALKLREVAGVFADGFSAAEVLHGPATLVAEGAPVVVVGARDSPGLAEAEARLASQGARLLRLSDLVPAAGVAAGHPLTAALPQIAAVYAAAEAAARALGRNPDRPRFLAKETVTR